MYHQHKNYDKPLEYYLKAIAILQSKDVNHIDLASCCYNVGHIYKRFDDFKKATDYWKLAFEAWCRIYKKSHPKILDTLSWLIYAAKKIPIDQRKVLNDTYILCVEMLGAEHQQAKELGQLIS